MRNKIRKLLLLSGLISLSACVSLMTTFSGKSVTFGGDNLLRNDVLESVHRFERLVSQCYTIKSVHSNIVSAKKINNRWVVQEKWRINACGSTKQYVVNLREDAQGETDYTVGKY